ncbi:hypothetical protein [Moorena sp. SIO3I6]|nr:hypothetical protein [Moorena sp. SIO3I6]
MKECDNYRHYRDLLYFPVPCSLFPAPCSLFPVPSKICYKSF